MASVLFVECFTICQGKSFLKLNGMRCYLNYGDTSIFQKICDRIIKIVVFINKRYFCENLQSAW